MNDDDTALCAATAHLLEATAVLAAWGISLAVAATVLLVFAGSALSPAAKAAMACAALAGTVERYLAFRIRLDAGLFKGLAAKTIPSLAALDRVLACLKLRRQSGASRRLDERLEGARRLIQQHAAVIALQTLCFLLAASVQHLA